MTSDFDAWLERPYTQAALREEEWEQAEDEARSATRFEQYADLLSEWLVNELAEVTSRADMWPREMTWGAILDKYEDSASFHMLVEQIMDEWNEEEPTPDD